MAQDRLPLEPLSRKITEHFAAEGQRSNAYSDWAKNGYHWSKEDYEQEGFAYKYSSAHFLRRANVFYQLVKKAQQEYQLLKEGSNQWNVDIIDYGAGPGNAAAGVLKGLSENDTATSVTVDLVDPVGKWEQVIPKFKEWTRDVGHTDISFSCMEVETHLQNQTESAPVEGIVVVCFSCMLRDYCLGHQGGNLHRKNRFWRVLEENYRRCFPWRAFLFLVADRFPAREFLPAPLPKGTWEGKLRLDDESEMECGMFFLPPCYTLAYYGIDDKLLEEIGQILDKAEQTGKRLLRERAARKRRKIVSRHTSD